MLNHALHFLRETLSIFKGKEPKRVLTYACISNGENLFLRLRIVRSNSDIKFSKKDSHPSHILKVIRLFLSRSSKRTEVELLIDGRKHILKTSKRGFIEKTLQVETQSKVLKFKIKGHENYKDIPIDFLSRDSKLVVSDLDDTILKSQATNLTKLILRTLFRPLKKRSSFEGASEFYQNLERAGNKIIYVSSSTWDLYPMIKDFILEFDFPNGPILLQNTRDKQKSKKSHHQKFDYLIEISKLVNKGQLILIGDEGQRDPEIYLEISKLHPNLVDQILIRKSWWTTKMDSQEHIKIASNIGTTFKYFKEVEELV